MYLSNNDIHLKLLANKPIPIEGIGLLQFPTVDNIIEIGEGLFNEYVSLLLFTKSNLEKQDETLDGYSDFDILSSILVYQDSFGSSFFNALRWLFNSKPNIIKEHGIVYFDELSEESILTEEKFIYIQRIVKIAFFIQEEKEPDYEPGNERARKFMENLKKKKAAAKKKPKQNLHSLISALAWKKIGLDKVFNLTIYQLYDGYQRLENIDNYHYTLTGIYTGNVDAKKINLPDINWANILNK